MQRRKRRRKIGTIRRGRKRESLYCGAEMFYGSHRSAPCHVVPYHAMPAAEEE